MSVSATASSGYTDPNQFVPVFASENATSAAAEQADTKHLTMFAEGDDEPSFWDLLDVINPLQHIPIVSDIYQDLTGDKIGVGARLAGGALFGGPIGLVASAIGCIIEEETGDDIGGHVMALFKDDEPATNDTQLAAEPQAAPAPAPQTADAEPVVVAEKPVQLAAAEIPAISLPEDGTASTNTSAGQTMMFTADGLLNPVPATTNATNAETGKSATPVNQGRFMPVPPRTISSAEAAPPVLSVPVSTSSSRSNVPITGRNNHPNPYPDPIAVQRAMAQQGLSPDTSHPMLPSASTTVTNAEANTNSTATNTAATTASGTTDWYQSMVQALDKYQKAGNLATRAEESRQDTLQ